MSVVVTGAPHRIVRGSVQGADCAHCPCARAGQPHRPVVGEGAEDPAWIAVGMEPGQTEILEGRPFVGPSGRVVNDALSKIRVDRESIYVTNALTCLPQSGSSDAVKHKARECCALRLQQELLQFPGRPILALGALAAQGFLGDAFSITQMAGAYHEVDIADWPWKPQSVLAGTRQSVSDAGVISDVRVVIPSLHPAAILRGGAGSASTGAHTSDLAFWALCYDAQKINLISRGVDIRFTDDVDIEADNPARAESLIAAFLPEARKTRLVAVDTETYVDDPKRHSALQSYLAKLSAIGLATRERAISVAWRVLTPRAKRFIQAILADSSITTVMHNAMYDTVVLARHGMQIVGPVDDTLLLHHNAFPGLAHDLQRVATQFFAISPWKSEHKKNAETDGVEGLLRYNARDALSTARLHEPLTAAVHRSESLDTYNVDMVMARVAAQMHVDGVPINREVNEQLRVHFKSHIDKSRGEIIARAFMPDIHEKLMERLAFEKARRVRKHDPLDLDLRIAARMDEMKRKPFAFQIGSNDHVVALLKSCGIPLNLQTATGQITTKKDVLESFIGHPEVHAILDYRENSKLLSTFCERMFDREYAGGKVKYGFSDLNDRVHPRWSVHKISGRWGSEAPPCFDGETEILTEHGWVRFDALSQAVRVAQYAVGSRQIDFVLPTQYVSYPFDGVMVSLQGRCIDLLVTPDHRFPVQYRRKSKRWRDMLAGEWRVDYHLPVAGNYVGGAWAPDQAYVVLLCAAQADGSWNGYGWDFALTKKRKVDRLCAALCSLKLSFRVTTQTTSDPFRPGELRKRKRIYVRQSATGTEVAQRLGLSYKQSGKGIFGCWLLDLSAHSLKQFRDEVTFWDGCAARDSQFASSQKESADWVQIAYVLTGRRAKVRAYSSGALQSKPNWQVDTAHEVRERGAAWYISTNQAEKANVDWAGTVYCVAVPSGYIIVRRNGRAVVTGNCQNWPKADKKKGRPNLRSQVIAPQGRLFVGFDMSQLEARIIALLSGDPFLVDIFRNKKDIHSEFARIVWPDFDQRPVDERKVLRDMVKRPEYCLGPLTRILNSALDWVPIGDVCVGDTLVGFAPENGVAHGKHNFDLYLRPAKVEASKRLVRPCFDITIESDGLVNTIRASAEHMWVARKRTSTDHSWNKEWRRTEDLREGDTLIHVVNSWDRADEDYAAGCKSKTINTGIGGGLWECLRFLGMFRPVRLLPKGGKLWRGRRLPPRHWGAQILEVAPVGNREVIALQTSTRTFIAEGLLSHNCSFYGGGLETAWKSVVRDYPNVTIAMMGKMVTMMKTKMPGVTAWHQHMMRVADQEGEVKSAIFGRRRCFPLKQFDLSECVNFPVQSTGADIVNRGLMWVMPKLPPRTFPILQIHDAVVFETPEDTADRLKEIVRETFTQQVTYEGTTIDFPVDVKVGKSWSEV